MTPQPPIKTTRAGIGCLASLAIAAAPFVLYAVMDGSGTLMRFVAAGTSLCLAILLGPFLIGWILGIDTVPDGPPDTDVRTPGPDDPVHFINHNNRAARYCQDTNRHDPHTYFWSAHIPYIEIHPDGREEAVDHPLHGSTECRGHW